MGLFDSIKKMFGINEQSKHEGVVNDTLILTAKERVLNNENTVATEPLIIKPTTKKSNTTDLFTQSDLQKLSKQQLVELGNEKFGIEMSMRRKKEDLIEEFLIAQQKV